jgi:hypothetical protein
MIIETILAINLEIKPELDEKTKARLTANKFEIAEEQKDPAIDEIFRFLFEEVNKDPGFRR